MLRRLFSVVGDVESGMFMIGLIIVLVFCIRCICFVCVDSSRCECD